MMEELRLEAKADKASSRIKEYILEGWPDSKSKVAPEAMPFFHFREYLVIDKELIYKKDQCVVPKKMREKILAHLHAAHMGLQATLRRAREIVFWPQLTTDITNLIDSCDIRLSLEPRQAKQPLQSHDIVHMPWAKVGADLFSHADNEYLVPVDYLTNFWEVDNLSHDTSSGNVIYRLKQQFARHGIPVELCTDYGPQLTSQKFEEFSRKWGFRHTTSSP